MKSAVKKVRVSLYGSRKWVPKEGAVALKETKTKVRKQRKGGWPVKECRKTVDENVQQTKTDNIIKFV